MFVFVSPTAQPQANFLIFIRSRVLYFASAATVPFLFTFHAAPSAWLRRVNLFLVRLSLFVMLRPPGFGPYDVMTKEGVNYQQTLDEKKKGKMGITCQD